MEGVVLSTELSGLIAPDNIVQNGYSIYSCFISRLKWLAHTVADV